jgi:hypothetical protein
MMLRTLSHNPLNTKKFRYIKDYSRAQLARGCATSCRSSAR